MKSGIDELLSDASSLSLYNNTYPEANRYSSEKSEVAEIAKFSAS